MVAWTKNEAKEPNGNLLVTYDYKGSPPVNAPEAQSVESVRITLYFDASTLSISLGMDVKGYDGRDGGEFAFTMEFIRLRVLMEQNKLPHFKRHSNTEEKLYFSIRIPLHKTSSLSDMFLGYLINIILCKLCWMTLLPDCLRAFCRLIISFLIPYLFILATTYREGE